MGIRKWILKDKDIPREKVSEVMQNMNCGYLLASVLCARGIERPEAVKEFLSADKLWHDPLLLPDMALAINRVKNAKAKNEYVAVFGDYDADGITATAIMKKCLEEYGLKVCKYIPDRCSEGYGLSNEAIDVIKKEGVGLIVTVDCGISSKDEIRYASTLGIDTIVTDHHNCPDVLPQCVAVINPKRSDSSYPCRYLSGAGVAYKFASALIGIENAAKYLELAAIGTVADVVELLDENRKITAEGLKKINENPSEGVKALLLAASKSEADSSTIAYIIAPRINCAGRIETPETAYALLETEDETVANEYAEKINKLNGLRQKVEQEIYEEAVATIKARGLNKDNVIVVGGKGWNPGVIGIAAAKITEAAHKPCILIGYDELGTGRASGRSVEGFNIYEALKYSEDCLIKYGGHAQAAGLSIKQENEEIFRSKINEYAEKHCKEELEVKNIYIDSLIVPEEVTVKNITELSLLEPCGTGNEKPLFALADAKVFDFRELSEGRHLKLTLKKGDFFLDAIGFGFGPMGKKMYKGMGIHAAGQLEINDYNGKAQLILKDILI